MSYYNWMNTGTPYNPNYPYTVSPGQQYQSYNYLPPQQSPQGGPNGIIWVDGEVGAKAYQMPAGWPCGIPIALWDTNDTVIYLKSINQAGMPNPLQKLHYTMENQQSLPAAVPVESTPEPGKYVTKEDFETFKTELMDLVTSPNQNETKNRGGNR